MEVVDTQGRFEALDPTSLIARLRLIRVGPYGAFVLWHTTDGPSLSVHVNGEFAYIRYFPSQSTNHAGFQPIGMTPSGCEHDVHFVQSDGGEADSFDMTPAAVVAVDLAYRAAAEFLADPGRPGCVKWLEL